MNRIIVLFMMIFISVNVFAVKFVSKTNTYCYPDKDIIVVNKTFDFDNDLVTLKDFNLNNSIEELIKNKRFYLIENNRIDNYSIYKSNFMDSNLNYNLYLLNEKIKEYSNFNLYFIKEDESIIWDHIQIKDNDLIVLDLKKMDDCYVMVYTDTMFIFVDYIYNFNKKVYIEYRLPLTIKIPAIISSTGSKLKYNVSSASVLSNNIIKIIYDDNRIEYWKVKSNNKPLKTKSIYSNVFDIDNTLIWTNNMGKGSGNNSSYMNDNSIRQDTEPTIEQLKEKFPDDTFFE